MTGSCSASKLLNACRQRLFVFHLGAHLQLGPVAGYFLDAVAHHSQQPGDLALHARHFLQDVLVGLVGNQLGFLTRRLNDVGRAILRRLHRGTFVQQKLRIAAGLLHDTGGIFLRLRKNAIAVGENARRFLYFFRHRYPHLINDFERPFLVHHRVPAERDMLPFVDQIFQPIHQMLDVHVTLPANYGDFVPSPYYVRAPLKRCCSACATCGGTMVLTSPPSSATSRTILELM